MNHSSYRPDGKPPGLIMKLGMGKPLSIIHVQYIDCIYIIYTCIHVLFAHTVCLYHVFLIGLLVGMQSVCISVCNVKSYNDQYVCTHYLSPQLPKHTTARVLLYTLYMHVHVETCIHMCMIYMYM